MPWIHHPATQDGPVSIVRWLKYHIGWRLWELGHRLEDEALHPDRKCDGCGELRRKGDHRHCDDLPF